MSADNAVTESVKASNGEQTYAKASIPCEERTGRSGNTSDWCQAELVLMITLVQ